MTKKLLTIAILAGIFSGSLIPNRAFALDACQNNTRPLTQTQDCCCKETVKNSYVCQPMTTKLDKKCPGVISSTLTQTEKDENAKYTVKISTQKDDSCICQFRIE